MRSAQLERDTRPRSESRQQIPDRLTARDPTHRPANTGRWCRWEAAKARREAMERDRCPVAVVARVRVPSSREHIRPLVTGSPDRTGSDGQDPEWWPAKAEVPAALRPSAKRPAA